MFRRRPFLALAGLVSALALVVVGQQAGATHTPADKVVASSSKVEVFAATVSPGTVTLPSVPLLTARVRSSKPSDLMLHLAAECDIFTFVYREGVSSLHQANGRVRLWIEVDGQIVPINTRSEPPQDPTTQPPGNETDKVTFCRRDQAMGQFNLVPDEIEAWVERNKQANAFNWVRLNVGAGEHTIVVRGDLTAEANSFPPTVSGFAQVRAAVANRTLIVEPTKMSVDSLVVETGTS